MLKNYIKIAWKVFNRKRLFSIISLYGIVSPLVFIILIVSFLTHLMKNEPPLSKRKHIFYLDMITWIEYDDNGNTRREMGNFPSYSFIKENLKYMKSLKIVSAISIPDYNTYVYIKTFFELILCVFYWVFLIR